MSDYQLRRSAIVNLGLLKKIDWFLCSVIILTVLYSVFYLGVLDKFWFEDDAFVYAYARDIKNPFEIFVNPDVMRKFGTGASAVPMQLLSYWLDVKIFGVSTVAAYLHSTITLVFAASLLYLFFKKLTSERFGSAFVTLIWISLPSTIAVHYFISTRHYMEGFVWSLAACLTTVIVCGDKNRAKNQWLFVLMCIFVLAAMLSKELYVTTVPTFIFLYSLSKKRYDVAVSQFVIVVVYICYRFWIIGGVGNYPVSRLDWPNYLKYLAVLPYTLAAHNGGYIIIAGLAIGFLWLIVMRTREAASPLIMVVCLIFAALIASYPTASPVLGSYMVPGTWYRGTFIINLVITLSIGYLVLRFFSRLQFVLFVIFLIILVPGVRQTRDYWNYRLTNAENESRFYLANPDKLLLSQERAYWYIQNIHRLYKVNLPHYLNMQSLKGDHAKTMVENFPTIWRIEDGLAFPDDQLYWKVRLDNRQ